MNKLKVLEFFNIINTKNINALTFFETIFEFNDFKDFRFKFVE